MGERIPGVAGTDPPLAGGEVNQGNVLPRSGTVIPGPSGDDPEPPVIPLLDRMITVVTKDWDPPSPRTTPEIVVGGTTLAQAGAALDRLPEWGEGGGRLRTDRVPAGTSATVTVNVRANLVFRLPRWTGYGRASAAVKAEWDRMVAKLRLHEQRHLDIAIEEANNLATALNGKEIAEIAQLVTDANQTLHQRQEQLDTDTDHGAKPGVTYGDVILDTSIT